jgi:hypothetical protein
MQPVLRHAACAACAIAFAASVGCGSPATRFYALTPFPQEAGQKVAGRQGPAIGLGPVSLPERLDRPQIVTWTGEHTLHLAEFDQWAAPLKDSVSRVLADNLAALVPTDRVAVFPWTADEQFEFEVRVEVSRFEGSLGKDCTLAARWLILRRADRQTLAGRSSHAAPAGESYASLVAAQSRLLAALSRDLVAGLGAIPR